MCSPWRTHPVLQKPPRGAVNDPVVKVLGGRQVLKEAPGGEVPSVKLAASVDTHRDAER